MRDIKTKTIDGFMWLLAGKGFQSILKIIVLAMLARLLSPEDFGLVAISIVLLGFSKILVDLGVGPALVQKKSIDQGHISSGFYISIILSLFLGLVIFSSRVTISEFFNTPELYNVLPIVTIIFILKSFSLVNESIALKELHFKRLAVIEFTSYFFGYAVLSTILAKLGYGYFSIIWAIFLQELIRTLLIIIFFPVKLTLEIDRAKSIELLSFGFGNTIGKVANSLGNTLDQIMLSKYAGVSSLGTYSRAYQLGVMPLNIIGSSVNKVLFSSFSLIQDETERLRRNYYRAYALASFLVFPIMMILYTQSDAIIYIVLGDGWSSAASILQLMAFGMFFRLANKINDSMARALGLIYKRAVVQCIFALVVGFSSFYFVSSGVQAIVWCVNTALAINFLLMTILIGRKISLSIGRVIESALTGLLASLIVLAVNVSFGYLSPMLGLESAELISMFIVSIVSLCLIVAGLIFIPNLLLRKESLFLKDLLDRYKKTSPCYK